MLIDNQLLQRSDEVSLAWDYVHEAFPPGMVEEMFERYVACVRALAADPRGEYPPVEPTCAAKLGKYGAHLAAYRRPTPAALTLPAGNSTADDAILLAITKMVSTRRAGLERVPQNANLLENGFDSLGFVQLIRDVEQRYHVQVPLASALAQPTSACIAELVSVARGEGGTAGQNHGMQLLRGRRENEGATDEYVVCVHGGFGSIDVYAELALHAPDNAEVWGLAYPGLKYNYPQVADLQQLAEDYAELVRREFPDRAKVTIVGWSLGGSIAHQLAGELLEAFDVSVALLDSLAPGIQVETALDSVARGQALFESVAERMGIVLPATGFADVSWWDELVDNCRAVGKESAFVYEVAREISPTLVADLGLAGQSVTIREFNALRSLLAARNAFVPAKSIESAILVLPSDGEARSSKGWERYIGSVQTIACEGNHYSILLGEGAFSTAGIIWGSGRGRAN